MSGLLQPIALKELNLTAGDAAAECEAQFAALVQRQTRFVFRIAYTVVRNVHDAEDIVQDTFLKLYRSGAWKGIENEQAFLARAAWRLAVDYSSRKHGVKQFSETRKQQTPEEELLRLDREALVRRLIDALPEDLRLPLALSAIDDLCSTDIAEVLGIPDGTVRTRIARARKILKEKLTAVMEGRRAR
jgi:RNA polymerase sigma-70 factor (ECF subfamily)